MDCYNEKNIYAGIVTYNPDMNRLNENITAISPQVDKVVIFDNGSKNQEEIIKRYSKQVVIIKSDQNLGIAYALNRLMEYGRDNKYEKMLSLDQDSVCGKEFVEKLMPIFNSDDKAAIVAPVIVDRNIGIVGHNPQTEFAIVNTCITSGSIVRIDIWQMVGGYDVSMFIDSVDFEFCLRVRKAGYHVIQVRDVRLLHEIGKSEKRRFLFWKVDVRGHSAFRKYYIARNNVYYPLKHKLWLYFIRGNLRNIRAIIFVLLYEDNKAPKVSRILKGWSNGITEGRKSLSKQ